MNDRYEKSIKKVADFLKEHTRFLIASHFNPDADAYGSVSGLGLALRDNGATVAFLNESGYSDRYSYIPQANETRSEVPNGKWDAALILDCGSFARVGDKLMRDLTGLPAIINIDHHTSNDNFGTINLVDESACSTAELVYRLILQMGFKPSGAIATALLAGIMGDTGSFRYASTTAGTLTMAAELVRAGAVPHQIAAAMYGNNSIASVRLKAEALRTMELLESDKIAEVTVTQAMYAQFSASQEDAEDLVELARDISGVLVAVVIKQDGEIWRVSLRSVEERLNVAEVAATFGGGGHKMAAGFRYRGKLSDLKITLRARLAELIR